MKKRASFCTMGYFLTFILFHYITGAHNVIIR